MLFKFFVVRTKIHEYHVRHCLVEVLSKAIILRMVCRSCFMRCITRPQGLLEDLGNEGFAIVSQKNARTSECSIFNGELNRATLF